MTDPGIPQNVAQFIGSSIDSVAEMEALLLLREESGKPWNGENAAVRLYISTAEAARCLKALASRQLVEETPAGFLYAPASDELRHNVEELAETYRTRLIAITKLIHSKKSSNVQLFADVFRFRKDG